MLVALVLTLLLIFLVVQYQRRSDISELRKHFRGPKGIPILGSIQDFANPEKAFPNALELAKKYGDNFLVNLFGQSYLAITGPKLAEYILSSNKIIDKSWEYDLFREWFGKGLLTSTGFRWRSHRKILTPSFHYKILEEYVRVFEKNSDLLVDNLKKYCNGKPFDIVQPVSLCTLDIICETAMGTAVNAQKQPNSPYVKSVKDMVDILYQRAFSLFRFDSLFRFHPLYNKFRKTLKSLQDFTENIIQQRIQVLKSDKLDIEEINDIGMKRKYSFLDVLLRSTINGEKIPIEDVRQQVDTFMFEGHDTTAVGISFTLYCLSNNLDIQEKVYKEVKDIYENHSEKSYFEKLQEMKYLGNVIEEGLRLYPPVPVYTRTLFEDEEYEGIKLPKGLIVVIFAYLMHRSPEIYEDPLKFKPERFTIDNKSGRNPYAYVPFSAGPRNCIGQKFAMLEMKSTISHVLLNYKILPVDQKITVVAKPTLHSATGVQIKLQKRT